MRRGNDTAEEAVAKAKELRKDVQDAVKQRIFGLRTCLKSLAEWV